MNIRWFLACTSVLALAPGSALAGDKVLIGKTPSWVEEANLGAIDLKKAPAELIADWQHRIDGGVVQSYNDRAIRIDNPQALMEENLLSLGWLPDKGDLTVHRLEILRDGKVVNLLADDPEFDVIRREQGMEMRLLDGELSATMALPGLKVGDILRVSHTVSIDDQALGEEVQVLQYLGSKPWRVGQGRTIVSWPDGEEIRWAAEGDAKLGEPELRDGYRFLAVELPLAEPKDMPGDAPSRFHRPAVLRVGSFADWTELSNVMAPHFAKAAAADPGGEIAGQAAAIMRSSGDPLTRAAMAVRLVQDEVSYLLDGLNGGNYLPQAANDTWDKRYGDCKAKSVLLLALLQAMGIEAEPVLVTSRGGDALPYLLPLPGNFDHVIVRARIAGTDYWLDGTSTGTRLANIGNVPPFHYALPLRPGGADLVAITPRTQAQPDMRVTATMDQSAGIDFPQLVTAIVEISGPASASVRAMVDQDDPEMLRRMAAGFASSSGMTGSAVSSVEMTYDEEAAVGRVIVSGIAPPAFEWADGKLTIPLDEAMSNQVFNPDRSRPEWRDVPVASPGPMYMVMSQSMLLPDGGKGFSLKGPTAIDGGFANTRIRVSIAHEGGTVSTETEVRQVPGEIAPADVAAARRDARRMAANAVELLAPEQVRWRWDLTEAERRRTAAPIAAAFDKAIAFATEDDFGPLAGKAQFLQSIFDYEGALAGYDQLVERSPSARTFLQRSSVLLSLGERDRAIADLEAAYQLDPSNYTAFSLAKEMAYAGMIDEATELLEFLPVAEDERTDYADALATVAGLQGDTGKALTLLAEEVADRPDNPDVLNYDCWFRGLFDVALEGAVPGCTRAVERAEFPAYALDSRALVRFRLGQYDLAIADLDAVLALSPALAPSRYLRGVVRLKAGDQGGRKDIETALRMEPRLAEYYGRHGVAPTT